MKCLIFFEGSVQQISAQQTSGFSRPDVMSFRFRFRSRSRSSRAGRVAGEAPWPLCALCVSAVNSLHFWRQHSPGIRRFSNPIP